MAYSIEYLYRIKDRFTAVMNKMAVASQKFNAKVSGLQAKMGKLAGRFQATGAKLANFQSGLAALGAGVFLKNAMSESMQFQKSLNLTMATTGATENQMESMRKKALEWGASTQFSSLQVSGAMAELGKMGNTTNDIISLMPGIMSLAAAGQIEMAEASNFTMAAINQFGLDVSQAGKVADIFATGAANAATSVSGIASALQNTGVQAKLSGLSIEDTTASLMALAQSGLEGAEGGTMMMNALKTLQVMPTKVSAGFRDMGIDINRFRDATTGQVTDFFGLIQAMKEAGATGAQLGNMFDVRAMKAMAILVNTNTSEMDKFRGVMSDTSGNAKKMQDTMNKNLEPMIQFQSVMQNLKVIMGEFIAKALSPVLKKFNAWMSRMQKNNPQMLKLITYILMGITALGAILIPLGLLISTIGTIITAVKTIIGLTKLWSGVQAVFNAIMTGNTIAMIVIGIAALIAATILVIKYWKEIVAALKVAWTWIGKMYEKFKPLIVLFFGPLGAAFVALIELIKGFVNNWAKIKAAFKDKGFFAGIWEIAKTIFNALIAPFRSVIDLLGKVKDKVGGFFKKLFGIKDNPDPESTSPYSYRPEEAPNPYGTGGAKVRAEASVSVYTEDGMKSKPFESKGNRGYNLSQAESR